MAGELIEERRTVMEMEQQLNLAKRDYQILSGEIKEKENARNDYDKIIKESELTLQKLHEKSKELLMALQSQTNKLKWIWIIFRIDHFIFILIK